MFPETTFAQTVIVDVETAPIDGAPELIEEPVPPTNYKDPKVIADWTAKARAKAIDEAGLDPDLARIVTIGLHPYALDREDRFIETGAQILTCTDEATERAVLETIASVLASHRLVTFCGAKFDLPLLVRRFWYLGLPPLLINLDRYRTPHVDLYETLTNRGQVDAHKLSWYCRRLGWTDCLTPLSGADVAQAVREGRWDDVRDHCRGDLVATGRLAAWMGLR